MRPVETAVFIDKKEASRPLGLEFEKQGGNTLIIKSLTSGPFQDWNSANSGREVTCGDRIIAVGPFRGKASDLARRLERATSCQVTIVRPANAESDWTFW